MITGRPNTVKTKESLLNKWIIPQFPDGKITDIGLQSAIIGWHTRGLKPNTIKSLVSIAKQYHYFKNGEAPHLYSKLSLSIPKNPTKKVKALSKEQITKVFNHLEQNESKNVFLACSLGYHAGLRKGEVFGLGWSDVDYSRQILEISRSYDGPTKSGKNRIIPIAKPLYNLLYVQEYQAWEGRITQPFNPGPILRKTCKAVGVPEITFHGLRHTFATLALDSGMSIREVQELLGHANASTTIDIYWNYLPTKMKVDFT